MMLITHGPDRWIARDSAHAPARGFVERIDVNGRPGYHATGFHIVVAKRADLGNHDSIEDALQSIVANAAASSRSRGRL